MDASSSEWMSRLVLGVCCLTAGCVDLANICGIDSAQAAKLCRATLLIMHGEGELFAWTFAALHSGDLNASDAAQAVEAQSDALLACLQLAESSGILASVAAECVPPNRLVSWVQGAHCMLSLITPRPGGCSQLVPAASRILAVFVNGQGLLSVALPARAPMALVSTHLLVLHPVQACMRPLCSAQQLAFLFCAEQWAPFLLSHSMKQQWDGSSPGWKGRRACF